MKTAIAQTAASPTAPIQWSGFSAKYAAIAEQQNTHSARIRLEEALVLLFGFCRKHDRRFTQVAA
jgi:hypothetical protein